MCKLELAVQEKKIYVGSIHITSVIDNRKCLQRTRTRSAEDEKVNQTNTETLSKVTFGKYPRDGMERAWVFPSA